MKLGMLSIVLAFVAAFAEPPPQASNTWVIMFGDPARGGDQTTTITVSYTDSNGVKKEKEISASVPLTSADGANSKKEKVQNALNTALSEESNKVGGQSLAATGGTGGAMTITPSPDNPGAFTDAKIKAVKTKDSETGEEDSVVKPGKKAVAQVIPEGEILGQTSSRGPSVFFVTTELGTVSIPLSGSTSKLDLLKALKAGLLAQDPALVVWVDPDLEILFAMLEANTGILQIGAGSTDMGLTAVCKVQLTD